MSILQQREIKILGEEETKEMHCFRSGGTKGHPPSKNSTSKTNFSSKGSKRDAMKPKEELLLRIPGCTVDLIEKEEAFELGKGDFKLIRLVDNDAVLATIVKVGDHLQWPLTKDEPVVKLDALHFLFSLPMQGGDPLSYGVSFSKQSGSNLSRLDSFLKDHSCFSDSSSTQSGVVNWKDFAPRVEDYNGVLAKAIAGGTGEIVKGIFRCSNTYAEQVQKGGKAILSHAAQGKTGASARDSKNNKSTGDTKKSGINSGLKRVRDLSKMTDKISKSLLAVVGIATGSLVAPLVQSKAGKEILSTAPGEVLLASLDAVNKVLDAVEVAERQALSATSNAAANVVTKRYGENAGEATEDAFATAGHFVSTALNIFKIRKAINPASYASSGMLKQAAKARKS